MNDEKSKHKKEYDFLKEMTHIVCQKLGRKLCKILC